MLRKQSAPLNFAMGLDTKTDPNQVDFGKFLDLQNSIFTKGRRLTKRNGYGLLPALPNSASKYLTTFNGNLTAVGSNIYALNQGSMSWVNKAKFQSISLSVLPTVRSALNEAQCDSIVSQNNLVCTVYTEVNNGSPTYKYIIQDVNTGQNIINPQTITVGSGTLTGSPRVFVLGAYFIIVFTNLISGQYHLQYISISINNPTVVSTNATIVASYIPATTLSWDGITVGNRLFIAYNTTSGGQSVGVTYLNALFTVATPTIFSGSIATVMSICADLTNAAKPIIYANFWDAGGSTGNSVAVDQNLNQVMTATQWLSSGSIANVASSAQNGIVTIIYENNNNYSYDSSIPTHFLSQNTIILPMTVTTGTLGSASNIIRSLGLASKGIVLNGNTYILAAYQSPLQNTYFLIDINGNIWSRFAYENGGGYLSIGLPQAQVIGNSVYVAYLFKDVIQSTSTVGLKESIGPAGAVNIYSQTGINLMTFNFSPSNITTSEIGGNLNLSGGMLWTYDGQTLNEQGFHLFPDSIEATWSATGGAIQAQPDNLTNTNAYYYQVTYEWTDAAGNIVRSAPSIPVAVTTTGTGSSGSITVNIPYLRLTYKSNVKIIIYRWSVANEVYYQVTSLTAPQINSTTSDSLSYVDTLADSSIIGNSIIYTTGGALENIAGPAANDIDLFDDRLWLIDAENPNLLWYSKQVIQSTPVEMSDLLTFYVAPSTGAQGSTGPMQCLFPMDDKQIIFKKNAIYYFNGTGPDNTGSNNNYSQPIFITSSVGCSNPASLVMTPMGIMFQSDKGIWLLGRNLETNYIGAPVEAFNSYTVNSALSVPGTTQVRFTLSNGVTLMYDYFYNQWGTFTGVPAISATLYQDLHTFINSHGAAYQETIGQYLDGANPVLMRFTTSWVNLVGLQGYQRAYFFFLLGEYISPHKLQLGIAYDYNPTFYSAPLIKPTNFSQAYGLDSPYGQGSPYGGSGSLERWRVFLQQQRCQAFQVTLEEVFDPSFGVPAGEGLSLSGINLIYAAKNIFRPMPVNNTTG